MRFAVAGESHCGGGATLRPALLAGRALPFPGKSDIRRSLRQEELRPYRKLLPSIRGPAGWGCAHRRSRTKILIRHHFGCPFRWITAIRSEQSSTFWSNRKLSSVKSRSGIGSFDNYGLADYDFLCYMKNNTFVLIDGNAILHRSYHAMPRFEVDGQLVNAIYGFISILFSVIERHHPEYLAVAFDVKGPTFRDELFDEYKAKRVKPPQEFYDQIPAVWEFVREMEIPLLTKVGFEADDVIGTLAKKINGDLGEGEVIIVTGDQDTLQLVDQRTKVAMPAMGKIKETIYDTSAVIGKFGLKPEQIIDYKALSGDPSDNIPGVKGIGEKTATELLMEFASVEGIYGYLEKKFSIENLDIKNSIKIKNLKFKIKPRIARLLLENKEMAYLSKQLATIKTDVEFEFKLSEAKLHNFDEKKVTDFLQKYHFKSLIKRMPKSKRVIGDQQQLF